MDVSQELDLGVTAREHQDPAVVVVACMCAIGVFLVTLVTCVCCDRKRGGRYSSRGDSRRDTVPLEDLLSKPSLADPESVFSEAGSYTYPQYGQAIRQSASTSSPGSDDQEQNTANVLARFNNTSDRQMNSYVSNYNNNSHQRATSNIAVQPPEHEQPRYGELAASVTHVEVQSIYGQDTFVHQINTSVKQPGIELPKTISSKNISTNVLDSSSLKIHRDSVTPGSLPFLSSSRCSFSHEVGHIAHGTKVPRTSLPGSEAADDHKMKQFMNSKDGSAGQSTHVKSQSRADQTRSANTNSRGEIPDYTEDKDLPFKLGLESQENSGDTLIPCSETTYNRADTDRAGHVAMRRCRSCIDEDNGCPEQPMKSRRQTFSLNLKIDVHFDGKGSSGENLPTVTYSPVTEHKDNESLAVKAKCLDKTTSSNENSGDMNAKERQLEKSFAAKSNNINNSTHLPTFPKRLSEPTIFENSKSRDGGRHVSRRFSEAHLKTTAETDKQDMSGYKPRPARSSGWSNSLATGAAKTNRLLTHSRIQTANSIVTKEEEMHNNKAQQGNGSCLVTDTRDSGKKIETTQHISVAETEKSRTLSGPHVNIGNIIINISGQEITDVSGQDGTNNSQRFHNTQKSRKCESPGDTIEEKQHSSQQKTSVNTQVNDSQLEEVFDTEADHTEADHTKPKCQRNTHQSEAEINNDPDNIKTPVCSLPSCHGDMQKRAQCNFTEEFKDTTNMAEPGEVATKQSSGVKFLHDSHRRTQTVKNGHPTARTDLASSCVQRAASLASSLEKVVPRSASTSKPSVQRPRAMFFLDTENKSAVNNGSASEASQQAPFTEDNSKTKRWQTTETRGHNIAQENKEDVKTKPGNHDAMAAISGVSSDSQLAMLDRNVCTIDVSLEDEDSASRTETCDMSDDSDYDNPWDSLDDAVKRASIRYNRRPSRIAAGDTKTLLLKSAEDLGRLLEEADKRRKLRQTRNSCQVTSPDVVTDSMTIPFTRFSPHRHTVKGIVSQQQINSSHSTDDILKTHVASFPKLSVMYQEEVEVHGRHGQEVRRPMSMTAKVKTKISSPETKKRKK